MEELREIDEQIEYYLSLSKDNSITDVSEYDKIINRLEYFKRLKNEVYLRMLQLKFWEKYLSAIEKTEMLRLGGDAKIYSLTAEEKVAINICDRDNSKMLIR